MVPCFIFPCAWAVVRLCTVRFGKVRHFGVDSGAAGPPARAGGVGVGGEEAGREVRSSLQQRVPARGRRGPRPPRVKEPFLPGWPGSPPQLGAPPLPRPAPPTTAALIGLAPVSSVPAANRAGRGAPGLVQWGRQPRDSSCD